MFGRYGPCSVFGPAAARGAWSRVVRQKTATTRCCEIRYGEDCFELAAGAANIGQAAGACFRQSSDALYLRCACRCGRFLCSLGQDAEHLFLLRERIQRRSVYRLLLRSELWRLRTWSVLV